MSYFRAESFAFFRLEILRLVGVSHQFGGKTAVHELSVSFPSLLVTAIVGRSGSGKSTLLKMSNGLITPTQGRVEVFNELLTVESAQRIRLKTGYMVQGNGLFPHLTITQNISIQARLVKPDFLIAARVTELMELVGLPISYAQKFPHQLSGGEQQRVSLCRALFLNPSLLLMDEPFGALDPVTRSEIHLELLQLLKMEPRTVLLVTHDMLEARRLADYILILDEGRVQQFDTTEKVFQSPANKIVERILTVSFA